ncbi:MAG: hypothetical protein QOF37_1621, partial [Thermoleophilaceae bacterium]|nr:hypothetical protein [Thermoleophilaceae bacterium]
MRRIVCVGAAAAALLGSSAGAVAAATVTIGPQTLQVTSSAIGCAASPCSRLFANAELLSPGARLSAPADGVITSWGLMATEGDPGGSL